MVRDSGFRVGISEATILTVQRIGQCAPRSINLSMATAKRLPLHRQPRGRSRRNISCDSVRCAYLGNFRWHKSEPLSWGTDVLVRTDRGVETGVVLRPTDLGRTRVPADYLACTKGTILRVMHEGDRQIVRKIAERERKDFQICQQCIEAAGLPMKLVRVERLFGGERAIVVLHGRAACRFSRAGPDACSPAGHPRGNAADRSSRRSPPAGRLRRLRPAGLLPYPSGDHSAHFDADGQAPAEHAGSDEDFRPVWPAEVLRSGLNFRRTRRPCGVARRLVRVSCAEGVGTVVGQELLQEQIWIEIEGRGRKLIPAAESQVLELPTGVETSEPPEEVLLSELSAGYRGDHRRAGSFLPRRGN